MPSFIVEFWSSIFGILAKVSVFTLVRKLFPSAITARFVDFWVLSHLVLSMVAVVVAVYSPYPVMGYLFMGYGFLRTFEIVVYQTNVLLFDEYRVVKAGGEYRLEGYRRIVLLLLHNYFEIILWLACTYTVMATDFEHKWQPGTGTVFGGIYSSFITMTSFGDFDLLPKSTMAASVLLFHATVGLFMTLLSLARFISLIPAPKTRDLIEMKQMGSSNDSQ
ncbi:hypothetical protein [Aeromonas caviae]|uniref:hypothetical protein n=1 Tax=Aeromonas caviae TaxID=648 RepID=UPI001F2CD03B|nr:hypothetical protein [Aeromonas caviae]MCE9860859.1 hypothetical protein [Aeromonas caviae]MDH0317146.1 hypothetical protein [Aeromonas caviae]MDH1450828.1 hypothetical protein [Aeromonas caviae]MDH1454723.1 hypothetical protein [Aeromonas caviae]MDH1496495.1 hypothetical protein [Aeromonas caviae]